MKRFDRACEIITGICLALVVVLFIAIWSLRSPVRQAKAAPLGNVAAPVQNMAALQAASKPVEGWYVCRNLGIGGVPGVPDPRQRLKLCHDSGWVVYTYCTQPGLPVPQVSRRCTRISDDTYQCGARNQRVREYRILQTPVDTATPTATSQVFSTATPTLIASLGPVEPEILPTPTSEHRVPPTGEGDPLWLRALLVAVICLILLAVIVGAWIVWRVARNR